MTGRLELTGMEFFARHGCLESERRDGNTFVVDFSCALPVEKPAITDRLEDAVNYAAIYDIVADEMSTPSNLLENVAGRIISRLSESFPDLSDIQISVAKKNPPVKGKCQWSRITVRQ